MKKLLLESLALGKDLLLLRAPRELYVLLAATNGAALVVGGKLAEGVVERIVLGDAKADGADQHMRMPALGGEDVGEFNGREVIVLTIGQHDHELTAFCPPGDLIG